MKTEPSNKSETLLQKGIVVFVLAAICCLLWGSAFPCVKIGYRLFEIDAADTFAQITFAGVRFVLAGIIAMLFGSLLERKWLMPTRQSVPMIAKLCFFQTILQYMFFYIGLARTTGVKASIIEASNVFVAILVASLLFRQEKLTAQKIIGCLTGFAGVVVINLNSAGLNLHCSLLGEGFIFFSTAAYAFSSVLTKRYSRKENPVLLSAYQFILGGIVMVIIGVLGGGRLTAVTGKGIAMLFYLAMVSAAAFSLWGILLKHNPVSKVAVYGFMNPMFGVILSALLLKEHNEAVGMGKAVISLVLVAAGIVIVNRQPENSVLRKN